MRSRWQASPSCLRRLCGHGRDNHQRGKQSSQEPVAGAENGVWGSQNPHLFTLCCFCANSRAGNHLRYGGGLGFRCRRSRKELSQNAFGRLRRRPVH